MSRIRRSRGSLCRAEPGIEQRKPERGQHAEHMRRKRKRMPGTVPDPFARAQHCAESKQSESAGPRVNTAEVFRAHAPFGCDPGRDEQSGERNRVGDGDVLGTVAVAASGHENLTGVCGGGFTESP
jgi:hypothetical protein